MSVTFNISEIISDIKLGVATIEIQKKKKKNKQKTLVYTVNVPLLNEALSL